LGAELRVDKGPIKTGKGGGVPLVAPGIQSVEKGEFQESEFINQSIEPAGQSPVEVVIVFVRGGVG
jgi:hypothetical protein